MKDRLSVPIRREPQLCDHTASVFECSLGSTVVEIGPHAGGPRAWRPTIRGGAHK